MSLRIVSQLTGQLIRALSRVNEFDTPIVTAIHHMAAPGSHMAEMVQPKMADRANDPPLMR